MMGKECAEPAAAHGTNFSTTEKRGRSQSFCEPDEKLMVVVLVAKECRRAAALLLRQIPEY